MRTFTVAVVISSILAFSGTARALCVSNPEANLRSGPGTKYEKTWEVFKYMPFKKLAKKGAWYRVKDVDGDIHWIYGKLVSDKIKCAVVKRPKANVRTGPGTNHAQTSFSPVLRYYSFKVLKTKGVWVNVQDQDGDKGWIHRDLLWIPK